MGWSVSLPQSTDEAHDGQSAGEWKQQDLLEKGTPVEGLFALQLRPLLSIKHQHRGIFHEVYSAPIAVPAVVLNSMAGGAGVPQRRVTSQAELDFLRVVPA